jgi:NADH-quinone oxidoreductase subunit E
MYGAEFETQVDRVVARYPQPRAALLPLLHLCQEREGHISLKAQEWIASRLGLTPAYVHGVLTFYTMFRTEPAGKHVIWVCTTLSCMLRGSDAVVRHLKQRLGVEVGGTTEDGLFTLLNAECLGSCDTAPMMQIDDEYYEDLTIQRVDAILDALTRGETPAPGRAAERAYVEE